MLSAADTAQFFETKVRPVLVSKCYGCHTTSKLGGLRVDSRDALLEGGKRGPSIVPGKPQDSLLIKAISPAGAGDLKMPMGGQLTERQIADLSTWVGMGAPWPSAAAPSSVPTAAQRAITPEQKAFWAFQPIRKPDVPTVADTAWAKTPIDHFVLARLEQKGLKPVSPASKPSLIRRATFDLLGLPPTPEEVRAFVDDNSRGAYEKVIDRLLASPRYGERWARHWLDVVRYADIDTGSQTFVNAYRYRDWVIQSINQDMPYDQFVKAQIAADLMPDSQDLRPALGLFAVGPWLYSADPDERALERDDRVDVVTRGLLGMTVSCARCHDHKYDPISTQDYYAVAGVFASIGYHEYNLAPDDTVQKYKEHEQVVQRKTNEIQEFEKTQTRSLGDMMASKTARYLMAAWPAMIDPRLDVKNLAAEPELDHETLERWTRYLRRTEREHPYLKDWDALVKRRGDLEEAKPLAREFQKTVLEILAERRKLDEMNRVTRAQYKPGQGLKKILYPNGIERYEGFCNSCDLVVKPLEREKYILYRDLFESTRGLFDFPDEEAAVFEYRDKTVARFLGAEWQDYLKKLEQELEALKKQQPPPYPFLMGVSEDEKPVNLRVHIRGSAENLAEEVPRGFPAILSGGERKAFEHGSGRLELAESMISHPLFARVMANRIWMLHFGTGIVDTPSNFGQVGGRPSNPDLLEYLAARFRAANWSMKQLHKEMMLSAAYQLSAESAEANAAADPGNRLYWRANRRRLEVEAIRDAALFVADNLDGKIGGPASDLTTQSGLGRRRRGGPAQEADPGENNRRTVYATISRFKMDPLLALFDFPDPGLTCERRITTNIPLQRLFFLNSAFMARQADGLAARLLKSGNENAARIRQGYWLLYGREPKEAEMAMGLEFLLHSAKADPRTTWKDYAQVLLSASEFYFLD